MINHYEKCIDAELKKLATENNFTLVYQDLWGGYSPQPPSLDLARLQRQVVLGAADCTQLSLEQLKKELSNYKTSVNNEAVLLDILMHVAKLPHVVEEVNKVVLRNNIDNSLRENFELLNSVVNFYKNNKENLVLIFSEYKKEQGEKIITLSQVASLHLWKLFSEAENSVEEYLKDISSKQAEKQRLLAAWRIIKAAANLEIRDSALEGLVKIFIQKKEQLESLIEKYLMTKRINTNQSIAKEYVLNQPTEQKEEIASLETESASLSNAIQPDQSPPPFNDLIAATLRGDYDEVKAILERQPKGDVKKFIEIKDIRGYTAFHYAVRQGYLTIATLLYKFNRSIGTVETDPEGMRPLHLAAQFGHDEIVKWLIKYESSSYIKINPTTTKGIIPLHLAAEGGFYSTVKILLLEGADVFKTSESKQTAFDFAKSAGHKAVMDLLTAASQIANAISQAILASRRRPENAYSGLKAVFTKFATIKTLKKYVKYLCESLTVEDDKRTLVYCLARDGKEHEIEFLFKEYKVAFSTILERYQGSARLRKALSLACHNGHYEVVKKLLENEKKLIDVLDFDGCTALHVICCHKKYPEAEHENVTKIVELLFKYGVKPEIKNNKGKTAFALAQEAGNHFLTEYLSKWSGEENAPAFHEVYANAAVLGLYEQHAEEVTVQASSVSSSSAAGEPSRKRSAATEAGLPDRAKRYKPAFFQEPAPATINSTHSDSESGNRRDNPVPGMRMM